ncbi:glycoside hydrolase, family 3 domain protein [Alkaliphilus metalliredigens QYMF]|uniref:beta-N-acetylhexosaminidase n=1 Tax=Alkaliphilus metalliredigens (strain QYMF) TaxID=293826 RepID=A6TMT8_ALKMQ|nr:beta-N-acetylhexosaminidase [Alkaliphilus metalliredigens]ABR47506.1 glycoside hydrolase, family 3 domain protein [Alkaliphilus metalliredigens QYMF]
MNWKIISMMVLIIFFATGLMACQQHNESTEEEETVLIIEEPQEGELQVEELEIEEIQIIEGLIQEMTLEEKIGQLFMPAFRSDHEGRPLKKINESVKEQIKQYHLGGIILFAENIESIDQTKKLIDDMQKNSRLPMFIAVDEEGGRVTRLNHSRSQLPATQLPGNEVLGKTKDPTLSYEVGRLLGRELLSLGFNMNLAPVADVNTNAKNPVIGDRSFSDNPQEVGIMASEMARGLQNENVSAVFKHFPGHGDTEFDTHHQAVVINHDLERLQSVEWVPFRKGIEVSVDAIMTAHIQMPQITGNDFPATLSSKIITEILREEMGYEGMVITDALEMSAVSQHYTSAEAAVLAIEAGVDILLMPRSLEEAYGGVLEAVSLGLITEERIEESVRRILQVKLKRGVLEGSQTKEDPFEVIGSAYHAKIVKEIMNKLGR